MKHHDVAIIGGGCVGLSTAKHLTELTDLDIAVFEKEHHLAEHQSGRNSGVLHPGFNYPPNSKKAQFATEGTRRMKQYCADHNIPCEEFGVLVVAKTDHEEEHLDVLASQAEANGVEYERLDSCAEIQEHEPHAVGQAALYAPEAASVDSQQYVYALAREIQQNDVSLYTGHAVERVRKKTSGYRLTTSNSEIDATHLVNAAGLHADTLAQQVGVGEDYQMIPFRGEYYEVTPDRSDVCQTMIYPTPDPELPFLGVHYTRRTDGKVIVGPNAVLAFGREAYQNTDADLSELKDIVAYDGFQKLLSSKTMLAVAWSELNKSYRKSKFTEAAQRLVPGIRSNDLNKSYSGIRAQLVSADGDLVKDPLTIETDDAVHVLNAVSPGLTSSLPFGEHIAKQVSEME
ncbi:dehydrogenase [Halogeometricum borinquense DSM 11551]|uniref:Dehydrogenase n=1 Tax=Halogeometricum borinquense (strain ATCC 700274 / DSM 11551 / JCM 10706 / KCTC 4070 / PR3) TaxID=469382 RepID=E4NV67_HALBP|nr:L-2-hydroxyglutarate oxidase [Halogeometricum borinquense]ADQ69056.1 predicted dehydrogenase [Halogeometricum borinquense DSM 11551]ELY29443.1 dehydrogenase [Halogeometricum borinquense DSM 11551]